MATIDDEMLNSKDWYLVTRCNTCMTGRRDSLINFDENKRTNMKLADNKSIIVEGMGHVIIQKNDGKPTLIKKRCY